MFRCPGVLQSRPIVDLTVWLRARCLASYASVRPHFSPHCIDVAVFEDIPMLDLHRRSRLLPFRCVGVPMGYPDASLSVLMGRDFEWVYRVLVLKLHVTLLYVCFNAVAVSAWLRRLFHPTRLFPSLTEGHSGASSPGVC